MQPTGQFCDGPTHAQAPTDQSPVGPVGQPSWNKQRASAMPVSRYASAAPRLAEQPARRYWPEHTIQRAPLWCSVDLRDGNQALPNPMDSRRKGAMFQLLIRLGFKEIEVGYPSASETDFNFVRQLIELDQVPGDVTISVFTPARIELIDRTFEAIEGARNAVIHLCMATACLWRDVVFGLSAPQLRELTTDCAEHIARRAARTPGGQLRFEYSPETFNVTEPEFALEICDAVTAAWDASPDRPVTLNLPSTVETDSPNVFADQIEWMHRNLARRQSIILSVHPHNDRGTAVASAEMAMLAGADRVEGTLFGNGERTGNVCLATLALNMMSHGLDPQLDFSSIDEVRRTVEMCNQLPVHPRHPYVGDLVYTAFSGTHQDAIAKGLAALDEQARKSEIPVGGLPWAVPYLPIDPKDVGRTYEAVVRVNSQSGKGGIAHVLLANYGLDLPRDLRIEFAGIVQKITDSSSQELNSRQLWDAFRHSYLVTTGPFQLKESVQDRTGYHVTVNALIELPDGPEAQITGHGPTAAAAFTTALADIGYDVHIDELAEHEQASGTGDGGAAAYAKVRVAQTTAWGAGLDPSPADASLLAVLAAVNKAVSPDRDRDTQNARLATAATPAVRRP